MVKFGERHGSGIAETAGRRDASPVLKADRSKAAPLAAVLAVLAVALASVLLTGCGSPAGTRGDTESGVASAPASATVTLEHGRFLAYSVPSVVVAYGNTGVVDLSKVAGITRQGNDGVTFLIPASDSLSVYGLPYEGVAEAYRRYGASLEGTGTAGQ